MRQTYRLHLIGGNGRCYDAGVDSEGEHLFETDPSGVVAAYKAHAIGGGEPTVREIIERKYDEDLEMDSTYCVLTPQKSPVCSD